MRKKPTRDVRTMMATIVKGLHCEICFGAIGLVVMMLCPAGSCGESKGDEEAFLALYNAVQAAEDHYGQGLGRARVVEKYREEVREKVVDFKYKRDSMRSDVRISDEKGEVEREFKSVYTPEVHI